MTTEERLRPPSYVCRQTLAAELQISESTVDEFVRRGVLPRPAKLSNGCVRWRWTDVDAALASLASGTEDAAADQFIAGARDAAKKATEGRRGSA